jgi:hypothetical protein
MDEGGLAEAGTRWDDQGVRQGTKLGFQAESTSAVYNFKPLNSPLLEYNLKTLPGSHSPRWHSSH